MALGRPRPGTGYRVQPPSQMHASEAGPLAAISPARLLHHLGRCRRTETVAETASVFPRPFGPEHGFVPEGIEHAQAAKLAGKESESPRLNKLKYPHAPSMGVC